MKKLSEILSDRNASGVYVLEGSARTDAMRQLATENDLAFFPLHAADMHGKDQFLHAAAAVLGFPDYFGNNWDAFEDCLKDMSWNPAKGYVMVLNLDSLAEHSPDDFGTAVDILRDAAVFWRDQDKTLIVLLAGKSGKARMMPSVAL